MSGSLSRWAHARGYEVAVAGYEVVADVRKTIEALRDEGAFDEHFYDRCLKGFHYSCDIQDPKTVIMLSVPRPAHYITFAVGGQQLKAIIPPTYSRYVQIAQQIRSDLSSGVLAPGQRLVPLRAPLKSVAARIGLVRYGRNNITYTRSSGSFHQLIGSASDAPPEAFELSKILESPGLMESCLNCRACAGACPAGAIPSDRFLLRAQYCVTFLNEFPGEWPEWVDPHWHNAIVGCMKCQSCCPANAGRFRLEDTGVSFSETETAQLLSGEPICEESWRTIDHKLESAGLTGNEQGDTHRNLKALVWAEEHRESSGQSLRLQPGD